MSKNIIRIDKNKFKEDFAMKFSEVLHRMEKLENANFRSYQFGPDNRELDYLLDQATIPEEPKQIMEKENCHNKKVAHDLHFDGLGGAYCQRCGVDMGRVEVKPTPETEEPKGNACGYCGNYLTEGHTEDCKPTKPKLPEQLDENNYKERKPVIRAINSLINYLKEKED